MNNIKDILIVEDSDYSYQVLQYMLGKLGWTELRRARNHLEAIEAVQEKVPDLILMDIILDSSCDGVEIAQEVRLSYDTQIAFLSALSDVKTVARANKTGPCGYLIKPYSRETLQALLKLAANAQVVHATT